MTQGDEVCDDGGVGGWCMLVQCGLQHFGRCCCITVKCGYYGMGAAWVGVRKNTSAVRRKRESQTTWRLTEV